MRRIDVVVLLLGLATAFSTAAKADDVKGTSVFLCAAQNASVCTADGVCSSNAPWAWNIPEFIVVDLGAKQLRTTKASGENRSTSIVNVQREEGVVFLQGIDRGRAFSFQIEEETGNLTVAVAREGIAVSVFGVCTPTSADR